MSDSALLEIIHHCALRFDGYRWLEATRGRNAPIDFDFVINPILKSRRPGVDQVKNFAAFFALQRWLFKWGGDMLPVTAPEHVAFRFLFVHLHSEQTPAGFVNDEWESKWRGCARARIAAAVAWGVSSRGGGMKA